ncbi:CBASS cGAMP-activated phospholipase [Gracilimonas tropica]|uniref:CBASS cGAMP-activated phospholipase n=1 Tax=Gracilimonas tropica TaxID=454600 RepID=UPI00035CD7EF|nr:CBASS cGAMP-activated phospholipase [Gracilimonas tropica]
MSNKPFKILSIDGGGIRGIYPAKILSNLEEKLKSSGKDITDLNKYFDLICGTSTGGIIALGLALGMSSERILKLYSENANLIFGKKSSWIEAIFKPFYKSTSLEGLLRKEFSKFTQNGDTRLGHSKTRVCIPVYDGYNGKVSVLKTSHHKDLKRDYQYPAHDVALSTSSAPLFFKPHSFTYRVNNEAIDIEKLNFIDGGVFANNPTLIGILEALGTLNISLNDLKILSIGTGTHMYKEESTRNTWGAWYWGNPINKQIIDLMFSSQADDIANTVKFLNQGVGDSGKEQFYYKRLQFEFTEHDEPIGLDETDPKKLKKLMHKADLEFKKTGPEIFREFCSTLITPYKPVYNL